MQERTVYLETPASEKPEKSGLYFCFDPNGFTKNQLSVFRFDTITNRWFEDFGSDEYHPDVYLRPVLVTEVPDEKEVMDIMLHEFPEGLYGMDFINAAERGGKLMLIQLLPIIALLKEERDDWKSKALYNIEFNSKEAEFLKEENAQLKARVAELEAEKEKNEEYIQRLIANIDGETAESTE